MPDFTLETEHGVICVTDTGLKNERPALLLLHGNSSSSKIFRHMLESENLTSRHRLITFDLPGHGASSNAPCPEKDYTMSGYANLAVHILSHLNIPSVILLGWSLGGHIALEIIPNLHPHPITLHGLILTGTPPALGAQQCTHGFKIPILASQGENLMAKLHWTPEQAEAIARTSAPGGKPALFEPWMRDDALRTDGRARVVMFDAFVRGKGVDQVRVVAESEVLTAVINGAEEPFVDLEYIEGLQWGRLWGGRCVRMGGLGHAPFWEDPDAFEELLLRFLGDCCDGGEGQLGV